MPHYADRKTEIRNRMENSEIKNWFTYLNKISGHGFYITF